MPVRYPLLLLLLPAWLALLFYLPTLAHGYVWDDSYFLLDLPYLRDPALWWEAVRQPLFVSQNYFRPLPLLMFVAEAKVGGVGAAVFHLVNVLLHAANVLLVTLLARDLLPADARGRWFACGAGVLFALHPALVENVSWISDRFDLLMAFFILLAFRVEQGATAGIGRELWLAACVLGALLSKETGIVLLVLLPLWRIFLEMRDGASLSAALVGWKAQGRLCLVLAAAVVGYLLLRYGSLGFLYRGDAQMVSGGLSSHLLLMGKTFATYAGLLVLPFGQLSPVHPAATPVALADISAWAGLLLAALCMVLIVCGLCRKQASAVLALMALIALAPVSNLLPLTIGDNIAHDRYLILPVAFAALWLVCTLYPQAVRWPQWSAAAWLVAAGVCVAMAVPRWENNAKLWAWAYEKHPSSQIASVNYLLALVEAQRYAEAIALASELLAREQPESAIAIVHHNLALALMRSGDLTAAEREIKLRLDMSRQDDTLSRYNVSEALNLLAYIQIKQGRRDAAEANLREAVRLTPYLPRPHYNLALLHYLRKEFAEGDAELALTLRYADALQGQSFSRQAALARAEQSAR